MAFNKVVEPQGSCAIAAALLYMNQLGYCLIISDINKFTMHKSFIIKLYPEGIPAPNSILPVNDWELRRKLKLNSMAVSKLESKRQQYQFSPRS